MTKYIKTELGQRAFKERSSALSARQRAAFILIDGQRTMGEVLDATAGMGITVADFDHMATAGFLSLAADAETKGQGQTRLAAPAPSMGRENTQMLPESALYQRAYPLATQITASLGLRGFRLNLAVEAASGYQDLVDLLPKIRAAVGDEKCKPLAQALGQ